VSPHYEIRKASTGGRCFDPVPACPALCILDRLFGGGGWMDQ